MRLCIQISEYGDTPRVVYVKQMLHSMLLFVLFDFFSTQTSVFGDSWSYLVLFTLRIIKLLNLKHMCVERSNTSHFERFIPVNSWSRSQERRWKDVMNRHT